MKCRVDVGLLLGDGRLVHAGDIEIPHFLAKNGEKALEFIKMSRPGFIITCGSSESFISFNDMDRPLLVTRNEVDVITDAIDEVLLDMEKLDADTRHDIFGEAENRLKNALYQLSKVKAL